MLGVWPSSLRQTLQGAREFEMIRRRWFANPFIGLGPGFLRERLVKRVADCSPVGRRICEDGTAQPPVVVNDTILGLMFQTPLKCGVDISLCSLIKYVGGQATSFEAASAAPRSDAADESWAVGLPQGFSQVRRRAHDVALARAEPLWQARQRSRAQATPPRYPSQKPR